MNQQSKKPSQPDSSRSMRTRILAFAAAFGLLAFGTLAARLIQMQLLDYQRYQVRAATQQIKDTQIAPLRGTIYDTGGKVLAESATVWTIFLSPKEMKADKKDLAATGLAQILQLDKQEILKKTAKDNYYEVLKYKVEKPVADEVHDFAAKNKIAGIYITQDSRRYYPFGNFAATVLGFVGNDNQGLAGVEASYNETLTGTPGRVLAAKNAWGFDMPFNTESLHEAKNGQDLVLTIDQAIQHSLEQNLAAAVKLYGVTGRGAGIVMDVETGAILAMSTKPDYDPNEPYKLIDAAAAAAVQAAKDDPKTPDVNEADQALSLARQKQWRNKTVADLYEPGSVFKLITGASALDSGAVTLNSTFRCSGSIDVAGTVFGCAYGRSHGVQTFGEALRNSCNVSFVQIGAALGAQRFTDYFTSFGLARKSGLDLPGEAQSQYYELARMGRVELASSSFGQSNKVTPIQMAVALSTIANGGHLVKPHVVKEVLGPDGSVVRTADNVSLRQVISAETSKAMMSLMQNNVPAGANAFILGYRVGGKSGTAQKLDAANQNDYIASFAAIAPADKPKLLVLILLDNPRSELFEGGQIAVPTVSAVMSDALEQLGVQPIYPDGNPSKTVPVPTATGLTVDRGQVLLHNKGFGHVVVGTGTTVVRQSPAPGTEAPRGSRVMLYTDQSQDGKIAVPDFKGKAGNVALEIAKVLGLNLKRSGSTAPMEKVVCVNQSVPPGTMVAPGTVVTVELKNK